MATNLTIPKLFQAESEEWISVNYQANLQKQNIAWFHILSSK